MMEEMTYEQVVALERNIKIKNKAKEIVAGFKKNVALDLTKKNGYKFEIWSDQHNAIYCEVSEKCVTFICDFLHEHYSVDVTESSVFSGISSGYRGIEHLACKAQVEYNPYHYKAS